MNTETSMNTETAVNTAQTRTNGAKDSRIGRKFSVIG